MKNIVICLLTAFFLLSCTKDPKEKKPYIGKILLSSHSIESNSTIDVLVNDSTFIYNRIKSFLVPNHTFNIVLKDTTLKSKIPTMNIALHSISLDASNFFQSNLIQHFDTIGIAIEINSNHFGDYFTNADIDFKWENIELNNSKFKGSGYIILNKKIPSALNQSIYYTSQKIEFVIE